MIGGLLATIIASKKHRTGFATFSGILVALNVFLAIYTSSWDFWPFGWILFFDFNINAEKGLEGANYYYKQYVSTTRLYDGCKSEKYRAI